MKNTNHKSNDYENPVGPDLPIVGLDVPLWQVFVALFLIAGVLTAFKLYERNRIAPNKPVVWKTMDLAEFRQEQLSRRNILIWVPPPGQNVESPLPIQFENARVRTAVYMNRCLAFAVKKNEHLDDLTNEWIAKNLSEIVNGGLAFWMAGEKHPEVLKTTEITIRGLVELIEGG